MDNIKIVSVMQFLYRAFEHIKLFIQMNFGFCEMCSVRTRSGSLCEDCENEV
jgi:hypothetical protein